MAKSPEKSGNGKRRHADPMLLLALMPAAMLLALLLRPVWDVDIFWQLKMGELILAKGGPLQSEHFTALHLGEPSPAIAWAGQAAMGAVRRIGGWNLLRVFDAACWLGGFWAVAIACRLRGASLSAISIAMGLAFLAAWPTASIRPQSFGCLCFGLLLALQRLELRPLATIALGAPLLVIWQNLHPSVSVGVVAMSLAALAGWAAWLRGRRPAPFVPTMLVPMGILAIFATPDGAAIIATASANATMSIALGASEWLPLWDASNRALAVPLIIVALLAVWLVIRNRRTDMIELASAIGLAVMAAMAYRFVLFWAVALVPVIARAATPQARPPHRSEIAIAFGALILVAVIIPPIVPTRFAETLPFAALQVMRDNQIRGMIYDDVRFGGIIIDTGYPDWQVAFDGRYYRYTPEEWLYYSRVQEGAITLADILRRWNIAAFLLDLRHGSSLAGELAHNGMWRCVYARDGIVAYVPAPHDPDKRRGAR